MACLCCSTSGFPPRRTYRLHNTVRGAAPTAVGKTETLVWTVFSCSDTRSSDAVPLRGMSSEGYREELATPASPPPPRRRAICLPQTRHRFKHRLCTKKKHERIDTEAAEYASNKLLHWCIAAARGSLQWSSSQHRGCSLHPNRSWWDNTREQRRQDGVISKQ